MGLRKIHLAIPLLAALILAGCGEEKKSAGDGRMPVYSGLPPVAFLAAAVGGERVDSHSMLPEGAQPARLFAGPARGSRRRVVQALLHDRHEFREYGQPGACAGAHAHCRCERGR